MADQDNQAETEDCQVAQVDTLAADSSISLSPLSSSVSDASDANKDAVDKISEGVLSRVLPELLRCQATLSEVTENQNILFETVQQENAKFASSSDLYDETSRMMSKAQSYHALLLHIRSDMLAVRERTAKLKRRAIRLQQQRRKEVLRQEQERERERAREQKLVAKPAPSSSSRPADTSKQGLV